MLAWRRPEAEDGSGMAYIKDTANQDEEVTGETDGWKGRKDRWRVEGQQSASID